jgi:hypothetical protein
VVFSSTHIDAQGNLLNQPAAEETQGNEIPVEVQELGSLDLTSTETSIDDSSVPESTDRIELLEGLTRSKESESINRDLSSAQTDSAETKILEPSLEHKATSLSEENFISDESILSEVSLISDAVSNSQQVQTEADEGSVVTLNPETFDQKENELVGSKSDDATVQASRTASGGEPEPVTSIVELLKPSKRGAKKVPSKATRTQKKQPTKNDVIEKEQSIPQSKADVSESSSSLVSKDNASDDLEENNLDEKTATVRVE